MRALQRPGVAWVLMAALLAAAALGVAASDGLAPTSTSLDWQPALAWSEPWRWWTAALVHLSRGHLLANLAGCLVVAAFGWTARVGWRLALAWLVAWPLVHLALLVRPQLTHYAGLSGLLHAGVAIAAVALVWLGIGRPRWIGAAVLLGLGLKVLSERPWLGPVQYWPGWDIGIAPIAHATGLAAGLICAAVACATAGSDDHALRRGTMP